MHNTRSHISEENIIEAAECIINNSPELIDKDIQSHIVICEKCRMALSTTSHQLLLKSKSNETTIKRDHLSNNEIKETVSNLNNDRHSEIETEIIKHLSECPDCDKKIINTLSKKSEDKKFDTHISNNQIKHIAIQLSNHKPQNINEISQQHLRECKNCNKRLNHAYTNLLIEKQFKSNKIDPKKRRRKQAICSIYACTTVIVLLFMYAVFFHTNKSNEIIAHNIRTNACISKQNRDKESYQENKDLEELCFRFSLEIPSPSHFKIKSISPSVISTTKEKLLIEVNNPRNTPLSYVFISNKGKILFEATSREKTLNTNNLKEDGLYYWKLYDKQKELIFCGKIIVE